MKFTDLFIHRPVLASGLGIGTLFTLFMVPAVYVVLARRHEIAADGERFPASKGSKALLE